MSHKGTAFMIGIAAAMTLLLIGSVPVSARPMVQDGDPFTIGAVLAQPDGTTVTLTAEQIIRTGRSSKSFAIKEWFEGQPSQPRLVVVSTRQLPVQEYWSCDVTGVISTLPGTSEDGTAARQRVVIVAPENVTVYCSPNGRPIMFLPIKGSESNWENKAALTNLATSSVRETASVSAMDVGGLPSMPDDLDSPLAPIYCATIADAKAQADGTAVELQCRPIASTGTGFFVLGEDGSSDTLKAYYTGTVTTAYRVVRVTGTIQPRGRTRCLTLTAGLGTTRRSSAAALPSRSAAQ